MSRLCCNNSCVYLGSILAVLFGILAGLLFYFGFIPGITTTIWIALGIALAAGVFVIIAPIVSACACNIRNCLSNNVGALLAGVIGTIIAAVALLSISLVSGVVLIAVLVGLGALFFALVLAALACLALCLIN